MELSWLTDTKLTALNERKLALLRAGAEIADLSMINPDIAPPRLLVDKLLELAVRPTNHRYAVARGVRRLREAFSQKYADRFAVKLDPETEVCVTLGSKDALEQVLRVIALLPTLISNSMSAKRVIAVAGPAYPHYQSAARLNGFEFRMFPLFSGADFSPEKFLEGCAQLPAGSIVLLNFPHNPTGMLAPAGFYERLVPILLERDLFLINDFVYGELVYSGEPAVSILSLPAIRNRAVELYSISKSYSVPGWRVGAVLGATAIVQAVSSLKGHIDYGIFLPIQGAAAAALHAPSTLIASIIEDYARRASVLSAALTEIGWHVVVPEAGAAVWACCPKDSCSFSGSAKPETSYELAHFLLENAHVSCSPGEAFFLGSSESSQNPDLSAEGSLYNRVILTEPSPGSSPRSHSGIWLRFALVLPEGRLKLVVDRIAAALEGRKQTIGLENKRDK